VENTNNLTSTNIIQRQTCPAPRDPETLQRLKMNRCAWLCLKIFLISLMILLLAFTIFAVLLFFAGNYNETIADKWHFLANDWYQVEKVEDNGA
jgi:hypothetical protein